MRKRLIAIMCVVATLLGGLVAALTLLPRLSVAAGEPIDSNQPLSAPFTIANNNFIPLRHVTALLGIGQLPGPNGRIDPQFIPNYRSRLVITKWKDHSLEMDDYFTITPEDAIVHSSGEAEIAIIVTYNPWILPWRQEKVWRFITHPEPNGALRWYSVPPT